MRIATSLLAATAMSLAALMPVPVTAQTALCNGPCLLTGGENARGQIFFMEMDCHEFRISLAV